MNDYYESVCSLYVSMLLYAECDIVMANLSCLLSVTQWHCI